MKFKMQPIGTRKRVRVLDVRKVRPKHNPSFQVVVAKELTTEEGFILVGSDWPEARAGDIGTIIFTPGGPTGGHWKFTQESQPTKHPNIPKNQ